MLFGGDRCGELRALHVMRLEVLLLEVVLLEVELLLLLLGLLRPEGGAHGGGRVLLLKAKLGGAGFVLGQ